MTSESNLFTRFVEPGRVCIINYGPNFDKLATIVDIVNQRLLLIDGPSTGVARQKVSINHVRLTDSVVPRVQRGCGTRALLRKLEADKTIENFNECEWGKKRAAVAFRQNMNDLERFKLMRAHKRRQALIQTALKSA